LMARQRSSAGGTRTGSCASDSRSRSTPRSNEAPTGRFNAPRRILGRGTEVTAEEAVSPRREQLPVARRPEGLGARSAEKNEGDPGRPATRSRTVRETSTSPGRPGEGHSALRLFHGDPAESSSITRPRLYCMPARISRSSPARPSRADHRGADSHARGQEVALSVAHVIDLASRCRSIALQPSSSWRPTRISTSRGRRVRGACGRVDDIREQDRAKHAVGLRARRVGLSVTLRPRRRSGRDRRESGVLAVQLTNLAQGMPAAIRPPAEGAQRSSRQGHDECGLRSWERVGTSISLYRAAAIPRPWGL